MERLAGLVASCLKQEITDVHITGGLPTVCRKHGKILPRKEHIWKPEEVDKLASAMLTPRQKATLCHRWSVDFATSLAGARLRVNIFTTTRGLSIAIRLLPGHIPTLDQLNLHPCLRELTDLESGLVLFCGPTGSGKSTTIASLVEEINKRRPAHIITLEDPIEFQFTSSAAFVEQRELGTHFPSFEQGLLDTLREYPDIIVVGELRESEVVRLTLDMAESGHLVFATLHASSPEEAVYRMCNSFSPDSQDFVRYQLSSSLRAIIVQSLVLNDKLAFRIPQLSIMRSTSASRGAIRDNKLSQLQSIMETGRGDGHFTADHYRKEYLNTRQSFTPPSVSFRPSAESVPQSGIVHDSTLIDYEANRLFEDAPQRPGSRPEYDHQSLIIHESEALDDVIAQIEGRSRHGRNRDLS